MKRARKIAQEYKMTFQEDIPVIQLTQRIAAVMQEFTQSGYVLQVCKVEIADLIIGHFGCPKFELTLTKT